MEPVIAYLLVGAGATYISKIEKRVNVAAVSFQMAIPLGIMSGIGAILFLFFLLKAALIVVAAILLLVSKLKFIFGTKLGAVHLLQLSSLSK